MKRQPQLAVSHLQPAGIQWRWTCFVLGDNLWEQDNQKYYWSKQTSTSRKWKQLINTYETILLSSLPAEMVFNWIGKWTPIDERKVKTLMKNILATSDVLQESLAITLPHQSIAIVDEPSINDVFMQTVVNKVGYMNLSLWEDEKFQQELHEALLLQYFLILSKLKTKLNNLKKSETCGFRNRIWVLFQMKLPSASWYSLWKKDTDKVVLIFLQKKLNIELDVWVLKQIPSSESTITIKNRPKPIVTTFQLLYFITSSLPHTTQ